MTNLIDIARDGKIYGIPIDELSYRQAQHAISFAMNVDPWLRENIGDFDQRWTVVQDREFDSLRIMFKNESDEVYFKLAWMQRDHESQA